MAIQSLQIINFRNLQNVDLLPLHRGLNILFGDNGSGKTSFLEAIYYLSLGRSFRSSSAGKLIQQGCEKLSIFAQLQQDSLSIPMGVERDINSNVRMRVAERDASVQTEMAYHIPIRLINSQSFQLFEAGPTFRRKYMDWGLFYQSDTFFAAWRNYERSLKQRNIVLRQKRPKNELDIWTNALIEHGLILDKFRLQYVDLLAPILSELAAELVNLRKEVTITYQAGWPGAQDLVEYFADHFAEEYRLGCTQFGPHRADLTIAIDGILVKHFLSRGQQKLLICAMILAQGMLLGRCVNKGLIYLIDDLPSELDARSRRMLITLLAKQQTQIFITSIDSEAICSLITENVPAKVFHVEQGNIAEQKLEEDRQISGNVVQIFA